MQKHLEDSLRIITDRENVIREQAQKIVELTQKLLRADESYQNLVKEAERMKTDSECNTHFEYLS
jgi:transposase